MSKALGAGHDNPKSTAKLHPEGIGRVIRESEDSGANHRETRSEKCLDGHDTFAQIFELFVVMS